MTLWSSLGFSAEETVWPSFPIGLDRKENTLFKQALWEVASHMAMLADVGILRERPTLVEK